MLTSCENDIAEVRKFGHYEEVPTEIARNIEMMYSDSLQVRVIVRSPELYRFGGAIPREEFKGGIEVDFIGDNLKVSSKLTADEAEKKTINVKDDKGRNVREPVVYIRENVKLVGSNGELMFTDELIWYEKMGKLSTSKWVRIITKDKDISGFGFESDKEFKNWRIRSVIGEIESKGYIEEGED